MANITGNCNTIFINQGNLSVQNGVVYASGLVSHGSAISIGQAAGNGDFSISIGQAAGNLTQGSDSIAIGTNAGNTLQGKNSVAIGFEAAENNQESYAIAIGSGAGAEDQGTGAIAIGRCAGMNSQHANTVVIGNYIDTLCENSVYIGELRANTFSDGLHLVAYDPLTNELTHSSNGILIPGTYTAADITVGSSGHIIALASNASASSNVQFPGDIYVTGTAHVGALDFGSVNIPEHIDVGSVTVHDALLPSNRISLGSAAAPWGNAYVSNVIVSGDIIPTIDNVYSLGSNLMRFSSVHIGPGTLFMQDQNNTGLNAALTVKDGVLQVNGANQLQVGNLHFINDTIETTQTSTDIQIGYLGDMGSLVLNRDVRAQKNLYVSGNIYANNHIYEVQTQTLVVGDKIIGIGQDDVGLTGQSGIIINNPASSQNVASYFNLSDQSYHMGFTSSNLSPSSISINSGSSLPLVVHGNVTASSFFGDATYLSNTMSVSSGIYGNAYAIPQITVASGRISSITNISLPVSNLDQVLTQNNVSTQNIICGSLTLSGSLMRKSPVTYSTNATVSPTDTWIIVDTTSSAITLTLPNASVFAGRELHLRQKSSNNYRQVSSSASNIEQFDNTISSVILSTSNKAINTWCTLVSDGTNWIMMAGI